MFHELKSRTEEGRTLVSPASGGGGGGGGGGGEEEEEEEEEEEVVEEQTFSHISTDQAVQRTELIHRSRSKSRCKVVLQGALFTD